MYLCRWHMGQLGELLQNAGHQYYMSHRMVLEWILVCGESLYFLRYLWFVHQHVYLRCKYGLQLEHNRELLHVQQ